MHSTVFDSFTLVCQKLLWAMLRDCAPGPALAWLRARVDAPAPDPAFYLAFGLAGRQLSREVLPLRPDHLVKASQLRPGFDPTGWTAAQVGRTLLLLHTPAADPTELMARLDRLCATAELSELVAIYGSLPLLPYPKAHQRRAAEGVRSTMTSVFDAVALANPYPHDYFGQDAWNQLVLKAVFNARPLHRIYGLDERRNPALATMLMDYAHERWAAGRALTPELWRLVGPYLGPAHRPDLARLLASPDALQRQAAYLALAESPAPELQAQAGAEARTATAAERRAAWQRIGAAAYAVA